MRARLLVVALIGVAAVGVVAGFALSAGPSGPASPPSWVQPDGTVDMSKMPDSFQVVDKNGHVVRCPNGKALTVSKKQLTGLPASPSNVSPADTVGEAKGSLGQPGEKVASPGRRWVCGQDNQAVLSPSGS